MTIATPTAAAELLCFNPACRARFAITEVLYNCPKCGGLIEAGYAAPDADAATLKRTFRERRLSNAPLDQSGVWRYRELFPFLDRLRPRGHAARRQHAACSTRRARPNTAGSTRIAFKHQGFNPTGSFKDNGMTCGVAQALRLGMRRVACVSTGNTSASMAAYAAAAGLEALIFLPHGNISFGKLAQALEYGAKTLQVEANFDRDPGAGPRARRAPGHLSAELHQPLPHRGPEDHHVRDAGPARLARAGLGGAAGRQSGQRLGVRQGAARSPGRRPDRPAAAPGRDSGRRLRAVLRIRPHRRARVSSRWRNPETLATAIRIGDPGFLAQGAPRDSTRPTAWWKR